MTTLPLSSNPFDCDRTCPFYERHDWCRFNPVFQAIGATVDVNSHTATVKADYATNPDALETAVRTMGGRFIGQGTHRLYENSETGIGFQLPNWSYPLVLRKDGTIAYDDYNGRWGNVADLKTLESHYTAAGMEQRATELGWVCQKEGDSLLIFHPSGGTLTVTNGKLATDGFVGTGCHEAAEQLTSAVGSVEDVMNTAPYYATNQQVALNTSDD